MSISAPPAAAEGHTDQASHPAAPKRKSVEVLLELIVRFKQWKVDLTKDAPLRIVHIIKHCGYGNGNVHVAVDLACVQSQAGHEVTLISAGGTFVPLLEQYGVRHVTLNHDQTRPFSMLNAAWKTTRLVHTMQPHVINAHMMSSALIGYIASLATGVPLVTTVHNSFDKHSSIMRLGHRIIAVSQAERDSLLHKGYSRKRLVAVMNAPANSPRDAFMDDGREILLDSPTILAVNALHRRKGVFDLIDACALLFHDMPSWKLYIAGEGPDREALEQQVASLGLSDRIIFLGFIPAPRRLLEQADIMVLASYADPCSLVIGEARAAGCAIVATDVGGNREMLDFGRAGRLVPPGHPQILASVLKTLMADDQERNGLRRAALKGSSIFDVKRLVHEYAAVYMQAREKRPG